MTRISLAHLSRERDATVLLDQPAHLPGVCWHHLHHHPNLQLGDYFLYRHLLHLHLQNLQQRLLLVLNIVEQLKELNLH